MIRAAILAACLALAGCGFLGIPGRCLTDGSTPPGCPGYQAPQ